MVAKKILIFNPFGIGDVLFTTPLIRNLKENLKGVSISYLCNQRVYPLLKSSPFLDNVFIFEKDEWRETLKKSKLRFLRKSFSFFTQVKKEKFDLVFDLSLNSQYGFFLMLTGIPKRIGFNFKNRGRFLTDKINIPDGYSQQHVARYHIGLLKFLNITPKEYPLDLSVCGETQARMKEILTTHGITANDLLVAVCPGSGDSWRATAYYKRWPKGYFLKLCDRLQQQLSAKILLLGSPVELELCDFIADNLKQNSVNLCGKLSLDDFCAMISLSNLVITNDGGPFHIAQSLGKKCVVFFGPVDEKVYGAYPNADNSLIFTSQAPCRPCYKAFKFTGCTFDKKCLRDINVEQIFPAVKNFLLKKGSE
jgi:lipopolysaccharide heptosyltransferase II